MTVRVRRALVLPGLGPVTFQGHAGALARGLRLQVEAGVPESPLQGHAIQLHEQLRELRLCGDRSGGEARVQASRQVDDAAGRAHYRLVERFETGRRDDGAQLRLRV